MEKEGFSLNHVRPAVKDLFIGRKGHSLGVKVDGLFIKAFEEINDVIKGVRDGLFGDRSRVIM